ncbi:hypothetical protein FOMPIDRAFT_1136606 [Fomitopsis schrenkii]|uniref:Uncharacterized protein n=1 Tax=Fomitopsis schrenkii TaxID=2126942 RepID=S8DKD7_FOMSC|nr:hypothetical protein FOMPIDRAFT_1136606 [Fomitopsis schrenkii]
MPHLAHKKLDITEKTHHTSESRGVRNLPWYLAFHAACCRVAHMSGAAKYLDIITRGVKALDVLTDGGEPADLRYSAYMTSSLLAVDANTLSLRKARHALYEQHNYWSKGGLATSGELTTEMDGSPWSQQRLIVGVMCLEDRHVVEATSNTHDVHGNTS